MQKLKWTILISINIILDYFCFWVLIYFETYINGFFIPESFIWKKEVKRDRPLLAGVIEDNLILGIEALLILFIFYLLNRWLFVDLLSLEKPKTIAKRIYIISAIVMLSIILFTTIQQYV